MIRKVLYLGVLGHLLVAFWNGFFGPSFGADLDAIAFHDAAVKFSRTLIWGDFQIGWIYSNFLGYLYSFLIPSVFLGSLVSVFFWYFSAKILLATADLLSFESRDKFYLLVIYAFLPSSILITSVTLREVFQLFFVNITIFSLLKIYQKKTILYLMPLTLALVGSGVLHGALIVSNAFILSAAGLFLYANGRSIQLIFKKIVGLVFVLAVLMAGLSIFSIGFYGLDDGLNIAVQTYQEGAVSAEGRATYKTADGLTTMVDLFLFLPYGVIQYLFEPYPWHVSTLSDLLLMIENLLRGWLILTAYKTFQNISEQRRPLFVFLALSYLAMEITWSVGTVNWGTAVRHHIPSMGILLLLAFFNFSNLPNGFIGNQFKFFRRTIRASLTGR